MKFSHYNAPISNLVPSSTLTLLETHKLIKGDKILETRVIRLRGILDPDEKAQFKRFQLPYVTFSGTFAVRKDSEILEYSDLICLDVDNIVKEELEALKSIVVKDPYVVMAFESPNWGYKIVVKGNGVERHTQLFSSYCRHFSQKSKIAIEKFDSSGKNLSRACFLSHDTTAYINPLVIEDNFPSIPFLDDENPKSGDQVSVNADAKEHQNKIGLMGYKLNFAEKDSEINFRILVSISEKKNGEYGSPREPWIQKLACLCNSFGMSKDATLNYCLQYYSMHPESIRESKPINVATYIIAPIEDAYQRYAGEFGRWEAEDEIDSYKTPALPDSVFDKCPPFIRSLGKLYDNDRDRDITFLSALCILSTCFPEVYGIYDRKQVNANLFLFVTAPASAGKGSITAVRGLGSRIQEALNDEYRQSIEEYESEMALQRDEEGKAPATPKPKRKVLFIPANNSSAKILDQMKSNKNFGVIMDTEADTLSQALKADWGNFSDIIRKAFHHEPLEMQRKMGDEYIAMERTNLSILLSGTPNQVNNLIRSIENGAFSRFMFYDFPMSEEWRDVFADRGTGLPEVAFRDIGERIFKFQRLIREMRPSPDSTDDFLIQFSLTEAQQAKFNNFFKEQRKLLGSIYGDDILPSLHRLGLIGFRISMILSIISYLGEPQLPYSLQCSNDHFEAMLDIIACLIQHTAKVFGKLANNKSDQGKDAKRRRFYNSLPKEFSWSEAKQIGALLTMSEKKAEYALKIFKQDGILKSIGHGSYTKI